MNIHGKNIVWGLLAGLVGGLAAALILWGSWFLPSMGLLLTRVSVVNGMAAMLLLGGLKGVLYALIIGNRKLSLKTSLLTGFLLGVLLWVLVFLLGIPLFLGLEPVIMSPQDNWTPLVALIFHGLIVSLIYNRWRLSESRRALYTAVGILVIAAILTPLMLRAALNTDPSDLSLPEGIQCRVWARGFTYPTSLAVDEEGIIYVAEAGYAYGPKTTEARIVRIDGQGQVREVARDWNAPINGLLLNEGNLYVSHRGIITELVLESGERTDLVTGLPSLGDHHNNHLILGEDGALYFGQGTATNAGVVGADNFIYAWADRHPEFHDIPSRDFILTGENYEDLDLETVEPADREITGAFTPFGQETEEGQQVAGEVKASGSILRYDMETGELSIYADGLRNPYGLALGPDGSIYASNLGYDDRGVRAVKNSPDWLVEVVEGAWYGWPDYAGLVPLSDREFASDIGINRKPLIANQPQVQKPLVTLPPHYSPLKMDFTPADFPVQGLLVSIFGDGQPLTEDLQDIVPSGVLRVDVEEGDYEWYVKNRETPRAGRLGGGFKRVIDVKFSPDGRDLYILDFGVMEFTDLTPNALPNTGVLWKLTAEEQGRGQPLQEPAPELPPVPEEAPPEEMPEEEEIEKEPEEEQVEEPPEELDEDREEVPPDDEPEEEPPAEEMPEKENTK